MSPSHGALIKSGKVRNRMPNPKKRKKRKNPRRNNYLKYIKSLKKHRKSYKDNRI